MKTLQQSMTSIDTWVWGKHRLIEIQLKNDHSHESTTSYFVCVFFTDDDGSSMCTLHGYISWMKRENITINQRNLSKCVFYWTYVNPCVVYIIGNCCMFPLLITQNKETTVANYNWLPQLIAPTYTAYTAYIKGQGSYLSSLGSSYLLSLFFSLILKHVIAPKNKKHREKLGKHHLISSWKHFFYLFCGFLLWVFSIVCRFSQTMGGSNEKPLAPSGLNHPSGLHPIATRERQTAIDRLISSVSQQYHRCRAWKKWQPTVVCVRFLS